MFSELPETLQDFTAFVWYVLACEEALANTMDEEQLDEVVDTLFGARQIGVPALEQLRRYARDARATYIQTNPARRRAWARSGTQIASASRLDELAETLADRARRRPARASARGAIKIFEQSGVLDELLELPDVPKGVWRFG